MNKVFMRTVRFLLLLALVGAFSGWTPLHGQTSAPVAGTLGTGTSASTYQSPYKFTLSNSGNVSASRGQTVDNTITVASEFLGNNSLDASKINLFPPTIKNSAGSVISETDIGRGLQPKSINSNVSTYTLTLRPSATVALGMYTVIVDGWILLTGGSCRIESEITPGMWTTSCTGNELAYETGVATNFRFEDAYASARQYAEGYCGAGNYTDTPAGPDYTFSCRQTPLVTDSTSFTLTVTEPAPALPDLTATTPTVTGTKVTVGGVEYFVLGKPISFSANVQNSPAAAVTTSFKAQYKYKLAEWSNAQYQFFGPEMTVSSLAAGASAPANYPNHGTDPNDPNDERTDNYILCADQSESAPAGVIAEANSAGTGETNNCSLPATVKFKKFPDLTAQTPVVSGTGTGVQGQLYAGPTKITGRVENSGGAAASVSFPNVFQFSLDGVTFYDWAEFPLADLASGGGAPGEYSWEAGTGTYWFRLCVDQRNDNEPDVAGGARNCPASSGAINEGNETNNPSGAVRIEFIAPTSEPANLVARIIRATPTNIPYAPKLASGNESVGTYYYYRTTSVTITGDVVNQGAGASGSFAPYLQNANSPFEVIPNSTKAQVASLSAGGAVDYSHTFSAAHTVSPNNPSTAYSWKLCVSSNRCSAPINFVVEPRRRPVVELYISKEGEGCKPGQKSVTISPLSKTQLCWSTSLIEF